jgi:formiminoglutamate deiminase
MYALAERLDPDSYHALARATFAEMARAGITVVGEFHYLHHDRDGTPYGDPNAMGAALIAAAHDAGIRLTLLDTCYLHGGLRAGRVVEPEGVQRRFADRDVDAWTARVDALTSDANTELGAAIHSVRAVDPASQKRVVGWAARHFAPLHAHVSEQPAENEECLAVYGRTPTQVLADSWAPEARFTAVHATHVTDGDIARLGSAGASVCLCPTTERDLADGVGPAARVRAAGVALVLGTDSHAVIDPFEEARAVELDERLLTGVRGAHDAGTLLRAATSAGYQCLGWAGGTIAAGAPADFVTVGLDSVRLAGSHPERLLDSVVFGANAADVCHVVVAGRVVVADGRHATIDVERDLAASIAAVRA